MTIDTKGAVATPPAVYIKEAGVYLFKIVGIKEDGYSQLGNQNIKVTFECQKIIKTDDKFSLENIVYKHEEKYCADENLLWKVAILRDALNAPDSFDFESLAGYAVVADIYMREYNGKHYANIGGMSYSKQNDKLPKIQEAKPQQQKQYEPQRQMPNNPPDIEVDDDIIPF